VAHGVVVNSLAVDWAMLGSVWSKWCMYQITARVPVTVVLSTTLHFIGTLYRAYIFSLFSSDNLVYVTLAWMTC